MTTPYSETTQGEWYQFDPNVHYYYDEQGQLHYYDPNTNQECDYQPHYNQQHMPQTYTPPIANNTAHASTATAPTVAAVINYAELASSRQPTPDVFLPCPEPTCNGENKPKSKFCEECGRPLGAISRSATPASTTNTMTPSLAPLTKAFSQQQIGDYNYYPHQKDETMYHYQPAQPAVDPLGRARGCPIVTFGFGGKMLVTFPRTVTNYYSSTVKPQPGPIKIKHLKTMIPKPAFPGPILGDSKVGTKQKKKDVAVFMTHMLNTFENHKQGMAVGSLDYEQLQAKILLWQLVKVLVETEGSINDKDKMDQAILQVLRPTHVEEETNFTIPSYPANTPEDADADLSDHMLSKIEHFLLNGDRKGAVDFAVQEDLWAHALIISSCVDKDLWQRVITNFVDREMNATPEMRKQRRFNNIAGNNQALRVMYSLFSGAGGIAMNEFLVSDVQHVNTPYGLQTVTPPAQLSQLVKWRDTLAIMLANRTPRDIEALTAFGDIMKEQGWLEAAHICYLLSPQNAMHSGIDTIQVRLTLLGSDTPNVEAYQLSEIFEFAQSLHTGASACLPFLQGYKLAHAWILSDYGLLDEAERYHDAIDQSIKSFTKGSPYLHAQLIDQVLALGTHLQHARKKKNGVDPASWLNPKFQKKTLTSLWGSLEGSFTKFVSGDEIVAHEPAPSRKSTEIMSRPF
ncbi:Sec23-binding domain of Sec16-domain-containing protein [Mucor mucedo]|uniref:Sec23-binding domain of Sec16-domain-containing protein n=1 Tax=Mucor mucedo TaxID=29922 RepID=UPI00221E43C3|nr:Sec23-binding domain of Sec16-domain-containing protein [Mucor mucedo]KAI7889419.1 Sec23-binding domain of Sec16-domain-containing protein [Mucor mucedo]